VLPQVLDRIELLGPKAADAVPRLRDLLDKLPVDRFDPFDAEHRAGALRALARIGPAAKAALPRLKELAAAGGQLAGPAPRWSCGGWSIRGRSGW
jgi:hypothetical protein